MKVINIEEKLNLFNELWTPKIIAELNGQELKLAKLKGDFVWHQHENEDELFFVLKGELRIELRDRKVELKEGEMFIVTKGIEHKPFAEEEVHVLLMEPKGTKHTGEIIDEMTVKNPEKI